MTTTQEPAVSPRAKATNRPASASQVDDKANARRRQISRLRRELTLCDATLIAAFLGVGLARQRWVLVGVGVLAFIVVVSHVFATDSRRSITAVGPVVKRCTSLVGLCCALLAVAGKTSMGRELVLGSAGMLLALVAARLVVHLPFLRTRYGIDRRKTMLVGDPQALEATALTGYTPRGGDEVIALTRSPRTLEQVASSDGDVSARLEILDQRKASQQVGGPSGIVNRIVRSALDEDVEQITVVPGDSWGQRELRELSWSLEGTGIDMLVSTDMHGIAPHRVKLTERGGRLLMRVGSASPRGIQALIKTAIDRLAACVLIFLTAPVLFVIAVAIRLDSPGSPLFCQTRVRQSGSTFKMYKFRTMHVDAEHLLQELLVQNMHGSESVLFKMENDPRVTRLGRVLRRTSLDELPQLINVVKGEMSLIGPRPALPSEAAKYDHLARRRLVVKPGMTGLWQVSGRARLTWDESIGFDLEYIDNWSHAVDASIAMRTLRAVITSDGAL